MARTNRIAILAALTLVVAVAGTVLATRSPQANPERTGMQADEAEEAEEAADTDAVTHAIDRLSEHGVEVSDQAAFEELAGKHGLGGAVRLYAWAEATGMTVEEIAALREGDGTPVGWGKLAKDLGVHPGIGSIMGNGRGPGEEPPGQERKPDDD
jgi:hypothetical protein